MEPDHPTDDAGRLEFDQFEPLVGQEFEILESAEGEPIQITARLVEARPSKHGRAHESFRQPFSLLFELEPGSQLATSAYVLRNLSMGELSIFLVPIQPASDGNALLEAVFN